MPGSKSYTNRALITAALTKGPVCLKNPLYSEDTEAMIGCLRTLGLKIDTESNQIVVHGDISCVEDKNYQLFAHDSGTTVRFMLALLCIVPGVKTIHGSKRLNERPISDLVSQGDNLYSGRQLRPSERRYEQSVLFGASSHFSLHFEKIKGPYNGSARFQTLCRYDPELYARVEGKEAIRH